MGFPKYNIRKDIDGTWQQINKNESIVVPSSSPYIVELEEIPDNGSVNERPKILGLTESLTYPPESGKFYVNYNSGKIVFHSDQAGNSYTVNYWARGSLVDADDINYLYYQYSTNFNAEHISVDTSNFTEILKNTDENVQAALEILDKHFHEFIYGIPQDNDIIRYNALEKRWESRSEFRFSHIILDPYQSQTFPIGEEGYIILKNKKIYIAIEE